MEEKKREAEEHPGDKGLPIITLLKICPFLVSEFFKALGVQVI